MKAASIREVRQKFSTVNGSLKPGERVAITNRGEVQGYYEKAGRKRRPVPDFSAELRKQDPKAAQAAVERILANP